MNIKLAIYLLFIICNILLMRKLLNINKNLIESVIDVAITFILVLFPIIGTFLIIKALYENTSIEKRKENNIKAKKFINKIFFVK